jgi:hypothetical protein
MNKNSRNASNSNLTQLSIPFQTRPFLETKKKVRGRNRAAIDKIEEGALELLYTLQRNGIQSVEARIEIREFLKLLGLR